jgi:peptidoglycan-associated lipoprotein
MILRTLLLLAVIFTVSACAGSQHDSDVGNVHVSEGHDEITPGPFNGAGTYDGVDQEGLYGVSPASQQDLVINVGDRVFFGYDRYDLSQEAQRTLELQAEWLRNYPDVTVTVEGHCDERGTREYNLALGERRANSMKNYLVAMGVSPDRVSTISYGKERPSIVGTGPTVWAQNRRGVMVVD